MKMEKTKIQFSSTDKKLYIGVVIIILVVIIVSIINARNRNNQLTIGEREEVTQEELENDKNQKLVAALQNMEEKDRMEYYFGMFLGYIEEGKYEKAYDLLYPDFKNSYFPTLEDFEKYIPTVFTEMSDIAHENIERSGDVYILWIQIADAIHGKPSDKKKMNIVIQEKDYNDFVMSFSVI